MIDFYYWPTPNGWKISIMLEECGLEYRTIPVNIGKGDQFKPEFLAISPNNRMPAIVDHDASRTGRSASSNRARSCCISPRAAAASCRPAARRARRSWNGCSGRSAISGRWPGSSATFVNYAQGEHPYSHQRYANEYNRCLGVLERRLEGREFIVGEYSIVDMCCWPWVLIAKPLGQALDEFPNVSRWRKAVMDRPAVRRGVDLGKEWRRSAPPSDEERKILFNQTARAVLGR